MFRFYKITRFANGGQWIDVGADCDLATVQSELEIPLVLDETVTEFLVYEG